MPDGRAFPWRAVVLAAVVVALAIGAAALAGIGPFDDDEEPSEADFLATADEICRDAHEEFAELQEDPPRTAEEAAALTARLIEISTSELNEIEALDPPDELEADVERYLQAREEGIALLEEGLAAARAEDAQGYAEAQAEVAAGQLERLRLARDIGLEECSRPLAGTAGATSP